MEKKEKWTVEKASQKPRNTSHERNNERKIKDRGSWKKQPKRKQKQKET